jgi:hypothetical protein
MDTVGIGRGEGSHGMDTVGEGRLQKGNVLGGLCEMCARGKRVGEDFGFFPPNFMWRIPPHPPKPPHPTHLHTYTPYLARGLPLSCCGRPPGRQQHHPEASGELSVHSHRQQSCLHPHPLGRLGRCRFECQVRGTGGHHGLGVAVTAAAALCGCAQQWRRVRHRSDPAPAVPQGTEREYVKIDLHARHSICQGPLNPNAIRLAATPCYTHHHTPNPLQSTPTEPTIQHTHTHTAAAISESTAMPDERIMLSRSTSTPYCASSMAARMR